MEKQEEAYKEISFPKNLNLTDKQFCGFFLQHYQGKIFRRLSEPVKPCNGTATGDDSAARNRRALARAAKAERERGQRIEEGRKKPPRTNNEKAQQGTRKRQ